VKELWKYAKLRLKSLAHEATDVLSNVLHNTMNRRRSRAQSGFNSIEWMRFGHEDAQKYMAGMEGLLMNIRSFANIR